MITNRADFSNIFALGGLALLPIAIAVNLRPELFRGFAITDWANAFLPIYIMFVSLCVALAILRKNSATVWTPLFLFPLQSAVFFGFGPLVEVFGNDATLHFNTQNFLATTSLEYSVSNALSVLGIMMVFLGFWLYGILPKGFGHRPNTSIAYFPSFPVPPSVIAVAFTLLGFCLTYLLLKPAQWGILDITVPGAFTSLTPLVHVGFGLVAFMAFSGHRAMLVFFWFLWPIHFLLAWLMLEKVEIILAILLPMVGAFMANRNIFQFSISMLVLFIMFFISQPYVTSGRAVIQQEMGNVDEASYLRRAEIAVDYITGVRRIERDEEDVEFWWRRLNYSGVQSHAIRAYDTGQRMDTFDGLWMRFIPRLLWPEKPIQTGFGREFYYQITGQRGSSLGLGIYGDAYWQFGFLSVFIIMPLIGMLFSFLSRLSLVILERREFIYFPLILLSLKMSVLGPLGFISEAIISPLPIMLAYYVGIVICVKFTTNRRLVLQSERLKLQRNTTKN